MIAFVNIQWIQILAETLDGKVSVFPYLHPK